jgi:hypothetical protein
MEARASALIQATGVGVAVNTVTMVENSTTTSTLQKQPMPPLFLDLPTVRIPEVMGESVVTLARASHHHSPSAAFLTEALYHHQHQVLVLTVAGADLHCHTPMETELSTGMGGIIMPQAQLAKAWEQMTQARFIINHSNHPLLQAATAPQDAHQSGLQTPLEDRVQSLEISLTR